MFVASPRPEPAQYERPDHGLEHQERVPRDGCLEAQRGRARLSDVECVGPTERGATRCIVSVDRERPMRRRPVAEVDRRARVDRTLGVAVTTVVGEQRR